jgi:hypothetical protein
MQVKTKDKVENNPQEQQNTIRRMRDQRLAGG